MSQVSMQANYGGYHPSNYFYKDDSLSRMGDRFADAIKSVPGAIREGEKWSVERNQRSAGNAVNAEARKRFVDFLTKKEGMSPEEAGNLVPFPTPDQSPEQYKGLLESTAAHLAEMRPSIRENANRHAEERQAKEAEESDGLNPMTSDAGESSPPAERGQIESEWDSALDAERRRRDSERQGRNAEIERGVDVRGKQGAAERDMQGYTQRGMNYQPAPQRPVQRQMTTVSTPMEEGANYGTAAQRFDFSDSPATVLTGEPQSLGAPQADVPPFELPQPGADFDSEFPGYRGTVDLSNRFSGSPEPKPEPEPKPSPWAGNNNDWADFDSQRQDEEFRKWDSMPSASGFPRVVSQPGQEQSAVSTANGVSRMTSEAGSAAGGDPTKRAVNPSPENALAISSAKQRLENYPKQRERLEYLMGTGTMSAKDGFERLERINAAERADEAHLAKLGAEEYVNPEKGEDWKKEIAWAKFRRGDGTKSRRGRDDDKTYTSRIKTDYMAKEKEIGAARDKAAGLRYKIEAAKSAAEKEERKLGADITAIRNRYVDKRGRQTKTDAEIENIIDNDKGIIARRNSIAAQKALYADDTELMKNYRSVKDTETRLKREQSGNIGQAIKLFDRVDKLDPDTRMWVEGMQTKWNGRSEDLGRYVFGQDKDALRKLSPNERLRRMEDTIDKLESNHTLSSNHRGLAMSAYRNAAKQAGIDIPESAQQDGGATTQRTSGF